MGKSYTNVWQIGRLYFFKGVYYQAVKEEKGFVTFKPMTDNNAKPFKRKQQFR